MKKFILVFLLGLFLLSCGSGVSKDEHLGVYGLKNLSDSSVDFKSLTSGYTFIMYVTYNSTISGLDRRSIPSLEFINKCKSNNVKFYVFWSGFNRDIGLIKTYKDVWDMKDIEFYYVDSISKEENVLFLLKDGIIYDKWNVAPGDIEIVNDKISIKDGNKISLLYEQWQYLPEGFRLVLWHWFWFIFISVGVLCLRFIGRKFRVGSFSFGLLDIFLFLSSILCVCYDVYISNIDGWSEIAMVVMSGFEQANLIIFVPIFIFVLLSNFLFIWNIVRLLRRFVRVE